MVMVGRIRHYWKFGIRLREPARTSIEEEYSTFVPAASRLLAF